jgi:hypothetical protein
VTFENLEDTPRVLQREIHGFHLDRLSLCGIGRIALTLAAGRGGIDALVGPSRRVILFFFLVPSAKETVVLLGVSKLLVDDSCRIRVVDDVFVKLTVIL